MLFRSNAIRLWEPELLETQRRWMESAFANGRQLVVEPWLERVVDFSVQLEMESSGLKLIGYTGLINDAKGQFQANTAAPNFARALPPAVLACFREQPDASALLRRSFNALVTRLEAELKSAEYRGPVGIDAFVYREPDGRCRLKPIVEINPRYTMGRLTLELMKRIAPGAQGRFQLVSRATLRAEGVPDFVSYARRLGERHPLRLEGEPISKIRSGAVCLNDPATAQAVLAVFHVGGDVRSL